ncbi:G/U mismatch-specific DNA glycosylase [Actinomadura rupiterrae]|uniref:G/U mismatch-specific DNA glycosylase n=1 Tax=Actinomadura rupiterrae TaxID=559627 RepID=UPI0020A463BB|nr:G/U mismatch-specific DNA glycosylase [Actinomadura rupiterrae]MCP2335997.1 TDG/mug DNA glycosylase family protein [Actinomadura rupiterrae]
MPKPTSPRPFPRPTKDDLEAAKDRVIPDVLPPEDVPLRVLFTGINPGLYSGATGHHFARPGNRFWPALYRSGFTPRLLHPSEQDELGALGLGITNLAPRTTARADELTPEELREGGKRLAELVERCRPRFLAVQGVTAYRTAFGHPKAQIGLQDDMIGPARVWVLPNPSGLNASWPLDRIAGELARLREAAGA